MECEKSTNGEIRAPMHPNETRTNLIINHLPPKLTDTEFHDIFATVGTIKSYRIMKDLKTGNSFGFGFVEYTKPEFAAIAILQLNNYALANKRLKVSYAQPPGENPAMKDTNLYVQNIPKTYALEDLDALFSPYGRIIQKLVFKDKNSGQPRGVAFVRFSQASEASAAIEALNGQMLEGCSEPLVVKVAKGRTHKKQDAFQAGFQAGLAKGRGRGQFSTPGGSGGRGGYSDMGVGRGNMAGPHQQTTYVNSAPDIGSMSEFPHQGGKIAQDRSNNRYNPIGGGGGYATPAGAAPYAPPPGPMNSTPNQYSRIGPTYPDGYVPQGAGHGAFPQARSGTGYAPRY